VDPRDYLPSSLRVPNEGEPVSITWQVDIGRDAHIIHLVRVLRDLQTAVDVGERWGTVLARAAAQREVAYEFRQGGSDAIVRAAGQLGLDRTVVAHLREWLISGSWVWGLDVPVFRDPRAPHPAPHHGPQGPQELVRLVTDARTPALLGSAIRVQRAEYRNPLEVVLTGSGFLILGTIYVLRLVRDWSSTRREGAAAAREAEAAARRTAATAELLEWLVDEAKAGRLHVPPGDLLDVVNVADARALRRLSAKEVQLQTPTGGDTSSS
jgi:hypothetical protein